MSNLQGYDKDNYNKNNDLNKIESLSQYLKQQASTREGRSIPPLDKWQPTQVGDIDITIKANGEWWHEGSKMTKQSLVSLFSTILCKEQDEQNSQAVYYLKTPVQKLRITVEDVPLLINDVGIVSEDKVSWLEFTTTTGDVVRLDDEHKIVLRDVILDDDGLTVQNANVQNAKNPQTRPYMPVRNGLEALIGRNVFYHLIEIGELVEQGSQSVLKLSSGGKVYDVNMPEQK